MELERFKSNLIQELELWPMLKLEADQEEN